MAQLDSAVSDLEGANRALGAEVGPLRDVVGSMEEQIVTMSGI